MQAVAFPAFFGTSRRLGGVSFSDLTVEEQVSKMENKKNMLSSLFKHVYNAFLTYVKGHDAIQSELELPEGVFDELADTTQYRVPMHLDQMRWVLMDQMPMEETTKHELWMKFESVNGRAFYTPMWEYITADSARRFPGQISHNSYGVAIMFRSDLV